MAVTGSADIAAHLHRHAGFAQDVADQAGGGGLAVGAGNADGASLEEGRGEFHFADDGHAAAARVLERREIGGNIGREHDQFGGLEDLGGLLGEGDARVRGRRAVRRAA